MKIYPHPKIENCLVVEKTLTYAMIHLPQNEPVVFADDEVLIGSVKLKFRDKKTSDLFDHNGLVRFKNESASVNLFKNNISIFKRYETTT